MAVFFRTSAALALLALLGAAASCSDDEGTAPLGQGPVVYSRTVYLQGLDEEVTMSKWPGGSIATRADGTTQPLQELLAEDLRVYRARFGAFDRNFHDEVASLRAVEEVDAAVYFRVAGADALVQRIEGGDEADRKRALRDLEASTARDAEAFAADLAAAGLEVVLRGTSIPLVLVRGAAPSVLAILKADARATRIVSGAASRPQEHASCNGQPQSCPVAGTPGLPEHNSAARHSIDTVFNAAGQYGANRRIGIFEPMNDECHVPQGHEAFSYAPIINQISTGPVCDHATRVASVMSGTTAGVPCGASKASYYVANDGESTYNRKTGQNDLVSACNPIALSRAYDWFSKVGDTVDPDGPEIDVVNESYGCIHPAITNCQAEPGDPPPAESLYYQNAEGLTQDHYARIYGIPITKAAGNQDCGLDDEACRFSLNSLCVGSANPQLADLARYSSFGNPGTKYGAGSTAHSAYAWDREEPDLVAFGGEMGRSYLYDNAVICTADFNTTTGWKGGVGTSFAAPAMASMVSLYREKCETTYGQPLRQRDIRAIFRTFATAGNRLPPAYSTPRPGEDYFDGAGILTANKLACPTTGTFGKANINLTGGVTPPSGNAPYQYSTAYPIWHPPDETQSLRGPSLEVNAFTHVPNATGWKAQLLTTFVKAGTRARRMRMTVSWDACATTTSSTAAPGGVSVDFDLFLRRQSDGTNPNEYVWGSQSTDDNNEGFDFTPSLPGTYDAYLMWPVGATNCDGGTTIPVSWARTQ